MSDCVDVVKTRIQTSTRSAPKTLKPKSDIPSTLGAGYLSQPKNIRTESVITALKHVYSHEGWRGLFRGMGPRSGWCGSQSGVMFLGYEFFLRILEDWDARPSDVGR
jgi:Mitochondrial carrier protein